MSQHIALKAEHISVKEIAEIVNKSENFIRMFLKSPQTYDLRQVIGRKPKISETKKRRLMQTANDGQ